MVIRFFFDSYAIVELIKANPKYEPYTQEPVIITLFNLAEIYWYALNQLEERPADGLYDRFRNCVAEVDDSTLREAMNFRKQHKRKRLSYADCVGYIYAVRHNMRFLTGDKEFEGFDHVEFVK